MTGNYLLNYINNNPQFAKPQTNITHAENKNSKTKQYLYKNGSVDTFGKVKPEPPKGHLIDDNPKDKIKYFLYDRKYDAQALAKGFNGTAKDHQLGRLNDVGLLVGGIAIATFIATRKQSPKMKLMEFLGFGAFLASMKLWPKIAIQLPAKLKHGFNVNKQYIDDQGRKKSVFQDPQYIPWDLYDGKRKDENFEKIGDKMGIAKNIPNRDEVVKEQMRKIATQNNTLWMLSAGFATPIMTSLIAGSVQGPVSEVLEKAENHKADKNIRQLLNGLNNATENSFNKTQLEKLDTILKNNLGKTVDNKLIDSIASTLSSGLDTRTVDAIKKDLAKVLAPENVTVNENYLKNMFSKIKDNLIKDYGIEKIETNFPKFDKIKSAINEYFPNAVSGSHIIKNAGEADDLANIVRDIINDSFVNKVSKPELKMIKDAAEQSALTSLKSSSAVLNQESSTIISKFGKEILKFKSAHEKLEKCATLKVGRVENSLIANSWAKIEKTLIKVLGLSDSEIKGIKDSRIATEDLFAKKLEILAKPENEAAYKKALKTLTTEMEKLDIKLDGSDINKSKMQDLLDAFSKNYDRTAKGISEISTNGRKVFTNSSTIERLLEERFNGAGSHKNMVIGDKINRIEEAKYSYQRLIKAFDIFKRANQVNPNDRVAVEVAKKAKSIILNSHAKDFSEKFNTDNNLELYKRIYNWMYGAESNVHNATREVLTQTGKKEVMNKAETSFLKRLQEYSKRMFHIVGNDHNKIKSGHKVNPSLKQAFDPIPEFANAERTQERIFKLIGKTPSELLNESVNKKFNSSKWLKMFSAIGASVLGVTLLTQFAFGKKDDSIKEVK